jgi:putative endonuclease
MPADTRDQFAQRGERAAEDFLRRAGLRAVVRRYRTPVGELDLVMRAGRTLVFVEVKTQSNDAWSDPALRVNVGKQRRLLRAVKWYLTHTRQPDAPCRFDVVTVLLPPSGSPRVTHFPDAFVPERW